jgi:Cof subfamily protein (haloacid dehalogenase superfamily)
MIKLITTDLDGTLLDDNKDINPEFWEIQKKLSEKGILFSIASGRPYYNLIEKFDRIKDDVLFLAENGAYVKYKDQEIHLNFLDKASTVQFIKIGRNIRDAYVILCGKDSAYVENTNAKFLKEARMYFNKLEIVKDLTEVDDVALKVTLCDFIDVPNNSYLHYKSYENNYNVAISGKVWLDLSNATANKGSAIEDIQKKLGISYDETMVFGDLLNDLEMMQVARYSFAMKNAHPDILKVSRHVTEFDNNNNGVVETIKAYCLND